MNKNLRIRLLWNDPDVDKVDVLASNGTFSGGTNVYVGTGDLAESAAILEGFPKQVSDVRELGFGAFGPETAGGGVHLRFFCRDSVGHAVVEIRIESEPEQRSRFAQNLLVQTALFFADLEASAVDSFVAELRQMEATCEGTASLKFT